MTEFEQESEYENTATFVLPVELIGEPTPGNAHITLVHIPDIGLDTPFVITADQLLVMARTYASNSSFGFWLTDCYNLVRINGLGAFGPVKDIPVLLVDAEAWMRTARDRLVRMLRDAGIEYATDYEWVPHITIPLLIATDPPKKVIVRPVELWYGGVKKIKVH